MAVNIQMLKTETCACNSLLFRGKKSSLISRHDNTAGIFILMLAFEWPRNITRTSNILLLIMLFKR